NNSVISVYNVQSGLERLFSGRKPARSLKLSSDFRVLASGTDGPAPVIQIWELFSGKEIHCFQGQRGSVSVVAWSPDDRLLVSGEERGSQPKTALTQKVRLWDTATQAELASFGDLKADVNALTFSPEGKHLAAGLRDGTILIYDVGRMRRPAPAQLST